MSIYKLVEQEAQLHKNIVNELSKKENYESDCLCNNRQYYKCLFRFNSEVISFCLNCGGVIT